MSPAGFATGGSAMRDGVLCSLATGPETTALFSTVGTGGETTTGSGILVSTAGFATGGTDVREGGLCSLETGPGTAGSLGTTRSWSSMLHSFSAQANSSGVY